MTEEMIHKRTPVDCTVCNSSKYTLFCKKNEREYVRCLTCNHVYVRFPPTDDELSTLYIQSVTYRISKDKIAWDFSKTKERFFYRPLLNKLASLTNRGRLLDIGCSNGSFVCAALHCGWDAYGVELNPEYAQFARERHLNVYSGRLSEQPFPSEYFSAITLWQVIEHLSDARAVLSQAVRMLKPGGVLAISTPNIRGIGWKLLRQDWEAIAPEVHLNLFDCIGLQKFMDSCDARLKSIATYELGFSTLTKFIRKSKVKVGSEMSNRVASLANRMSQRRLKIILTARCITNIPLKYLGIGEDIYGYFIK